MTSETVVRNGDVHIFSRESTSAANITIVSAYSLTSFECSSSMSASQAVAVSRANVTASQHCVPPRLVKVLPQSTVVTRVSATRPTYNNWLLLVSSASTTLSVTEQLFP